MANPTWAALDGQRREAFQRAVNVSNAGSYLIQNYTNRIIEQLSVREFGALGTMDRRPGQGSQAMVNRRTGATMNAANVWVSDTVALTESTGSYDQATFTYMTLATRGKVTRKMRARGRSYLDILADEMTHKLDDFNNSLESAIFTGDSGAISTQMDGLLTQINAVSTQVIANTNATVGDSLTLSKLDEAIDAVRGAGNRSDLAIYASFLGARKLNAALQADQQFSNMVEVAAGFRVRTYDGIPIIVSTGLGDDLGWSGSALDKLAGETTEPTTSLVIVNKRHAWLEELTPTTMMPLARDDSQFEQFDIFWDGACVLGNTSGAAILGGISIS
ncbi:MAG: hypothetical protein CMA63_06555 [Euryarchaeota archaeon]|nr:hypothetical protein [Euryarchaeota archaeon]|tara:strand:+ start:15500 stop:16495 length:996 start_codon:yes stop_codon:yes gene_type:complete